MKNIPKYTLADIQDNFGPRAVRVLLPPENFSVLTQVRQSGLNPEALVPSFLAKGQMTPGAAAGLSEFQARKYIETYNRVWGTHHSLKDLKAVVIDGELLRLPLIFGHRRHATRVLLNAGIEKGIYPKPVLYDHRYRADIYLGISAEEAIEMQLQENNYLPPLPQDQARGAWMYWRYCKDADTGLTMSRFAKTIGHSPEWVRGALRFCSLPDTIQSYVVGDNPLRIKLPYGILVDIARLAETYQLITGEVLTEQAMHFWIQEAIASRLNTTTFSRKVSMYLEEKRDQVAGQSSLFNMDPSPAERERHLRSVVAKDIVRSAWVLLNYFKTVERLRVAGVLGNESYLGPYLTVAEQERFSPKSPIRLTAEMMEVVSLLVPHLAELARIERTGHYRALLKDHPLLEEVVTAFGHLASLEKFATDGPSH